MRHRPDDPPRSRAIVVVTLAVFALVALYVLSTGPMTWLHHNEIAALDSVAPFYAPLEWLGEAVPPIGEALRQYKRLWEY